VATYEYAGVQFTSKAAVADYAQNILHAAPMNTRITGFNETFLLELFSQHPRATEKMDGVEAVEIRPNAFGQKAFWLVTGAGEARDIGYRKCLSPPSPLTKFSEACRRAVAPYVTTVKVKYFADLQPHKCQVTGRWITRDQAHVDHAPPWVFSRIVHEFIRTRAIDVTKVAYEDAQGAYFESIGLQNDFVRFHNEHATLRIVDGQWNIEMGTHGITNSGY
jgi:hypothetical protein